MRLFFTPFSSNPFLEGFMSSYAETIIKLQNCGIKVDMNKWKCSYCDSINTTELCCRNCGATESKGLSEFEGLPFRSTTFRYYNK